MPRGGNAPARDAAARRALLQARTGIQRPRLSPRASGARTESRLQGGAQRHLRRRARRVPRLERDEPLPHDRLLSGVSRRASGEPQRAPVASGPSHRRPPLRGGARGLGQNAPPEADLQRRLLPRLYPFAGGAHRRRARAVGGHVRKVSRHVGGLRYARERARQARSLRRGHRGL